MKTKIFHTVNCGLYFWRDGTGLLFDGLHGCGPYQCFSPMPTELRQQMLRHSGIFAHLHGALFSHAHGDHCDPDALYFVKHSARPLPCYLCGASDNTIPGVTAEPNVLRMQIGVFSVLAVKVSHNGVDHKHRELFTLPNCVFVITCGDEKFLIAADGSLSAKNIELSELCGGIDLVFCNAYHLDAPDSLAFLQSVRPREIAVYHLPFPEDDVYLSHTMASRFIRTPPNGIPHPFLMPHMAWYQENRPSWLPEEPR